MTEAGDSWRVRLTRWASTKVEASWYPWLLATLNFLDYFCLVGFVVPVLQGAAFARVRAPRAALICCLCATGGFLGAWCLALVLQRTDVLAGSVDGERAAYAAELLGRWGLVAGLINGLSPLPNIPLIAVTTSVEKSQRRVVLVIALMHLGRCIRFGVMAVAVFLGRAALAKATAAAATGEASGDGGAGKKAVKAE